MIPLDLGWFALWRDLRGGHFEGYVAVIALALLVQAALLLMRHDRFYF